MLDFTQNLTNNAGAFISGNGTIKAATGLTNNGTMNFSGLANVVGDVTNSVGGKIISSGGGPTTFFDDVTNQGEIRTSAGSYTVFFGGVDGAGAFTGAGTVNFEGDLDPGNSPAQVNFAGDVVFGPSAALEIELGGSALGSRYDQINVTGRLSLDGVLHVSLINDFAPHASDSIDILDWTTLTGTFSTIRLPSLVGTLAWNRSQLYTSGVLSVMSGIPGDYSNNGVVDAADYIVWRKNENTMNALPNDSSGGTIGRAQYNTWCANFGITAGSGSSAVANVAVAGPSMLVMLVLAAMCVCSRRRRDA